ncbi:MAG: M20 family peptidase, partial [Acetobacteraceae bacterium]|nr:M20 family peptidase [Acetobacteraceae bacterium]
MNAERPEALITAWLATQQQAMTDLLQRMVDTDSGSYDKAGTDRVGGLLAEFLAQHGIEVETLEQAKYGDCLRGAVPWHGPGGNAGGNIVLMGHRDTVFP